MVTFSYSLYTEGKVAVMTLIASGIGIDLRKVAVTLQSPISCYVLEYVYKMRCPIYWLNFHIVYISEGKVAVVTFTAF